MKIFISGVHPKLIKRTGDKSKMLLGLEVTDIVQITQSMYGKGSVAVSTRSSTDFWDYNSYHGVYLTCLDDEGYPLS